MKTTMMSASVIGAIAKAMYGRRRPNGVLVASESGPTTSGRMIAKTPFGGQDDADEHGRARELLENRRQVGRDRRDRPCEAECAEAENPDETGVLAEQ